MRELDSLRGARRVELAARLRDARAYGTAVGDDDHLTVLEDVAVARIRITQLERLIASATIVDVDSADDGVVGLGSVVRVRDAGDRESEYELVGRALRTQPVFRSRRPHRSARRSSAHAPATSSAPSSRTGGIASSPSWLSTVTIHRSDDLAASGGRCGSRDR